MLKPPMNCKLVYLAAIEAEKAIIESKHATHTGTDRMKEIEHIRKAVAHTAVALNAFKKVLVDMKESWS